jgi:hypothetical protein
MAGYRALEAAGGLGYLLSQQLVASGERVVDVPPVLASRVRVLGSGRSNKNDPNDARSVAIAALRQPRLAVVRREGHGQILRMLAKRHLELTGLRTQAVCRLHAVLTLLRPGGMTCRLSADKASRMLGGMRNLDIIGEQRRMMARVHLADIRRLDREIKANKVLTSKAVAGSGTTVTDVYGWGRAWPRSSSDTQATSVGSHPLAATPHTTAPHRSRSPQQARSGTGSA